MNKLNAMSFKQALDDELVSSLHRTVDDYESPKAAIKALVHFHQNLGAYFEREKWKAKCTGLEETLRRLIASHADLAARATGEHLGTPNIEWSQEIEDNARRLLQELGEDV
jgi:hypothetical protein